MPRGRVDDGEDTGVAGEETVEQTRARLQAEIAKHGAEWRRHARRSGPPSSRQIELETMMAAKQDLVDELEPEVDVTVNKPHFARCYVVGDREFFQGTHRVKESVAITLRYLMDRDRINEARRLNDLSQQKEVDPHGLLGIIEPGTVPVRSIGTFANR